MVFSSYLFLFGFLPLALALYYASPRRAKHLTLTLVSYVFYGWANPLFSVLMLATTAVDYLAGLWIAGKGPDGQPALLHIGGPRTTRQRLILLISLVSNLGSLAFFKYWNFGVESYNSLAVALGGPSQFWETAFQVTLPLGISFYTFQSLSYTIDVYRGEARALRGFIDFACFVSMFPQLVAGPIIRFQEVADQLAFRTHTIEKFSRGVAFVCLGLAKKTLLANPCGKVADLAFEVPSPFTADAWLGLFAYSFQIYFDFSGYSDMAVGLGLMLGFMFAKNFDAPYRAASITDFWRRWHISLSTWLRDYLYIPLGGSRHGEARTYANLALVMLLGGLWHGAGWTFLLWGAIHGAWLIAERALGRPAANRGSLFHRVPRPLQIALTFLGVSLAWIPFRAESLPHARDYAQSLLGLQATAPQSGLIGGVLWQPYYLLMLATAAIVVWTCPQTWDWTKTLTPFCAFVSFVLFWLSVAALTVQDFNPFIYFIF